MRTALDISDPMPRSMRRYISNYGWHFTRRACEFAVSMMEKADSQGLRVSVEPMDMKAVDELLEKNGVQLRRKTLHDHVFVANMCAADYLGSSVPDMAHLALFVKDYMDDCDASSETPFRRWVATMIGNGEPIDWEELA